MENIFGGKQRLACGAGAFSAVLAVTLAVLTNLATEGWAPAQTVGLVVATLVIIGAVFFDVWRRTEPGGASERVVAAMILRDLAYQPGFDASIIDGNDFGCRDPCAFGGQRIDLAGAFDARASLLVTGAPGAGKTALLREIAYFYGARLLHAKDPTSRVPILIEARVWGREHPDEGLAQQIRRKYGIPARVLRQWSGRGAVVLIVDGLDEAYDAVHLVRQLRGWLQRWPDTACVISTRADEADLVTDTLPGVRVLELPAQRAAEPPATCVASEDPDLVAVPETALKVLVSAALEDGRPYEISEISGRTMLPLGILTRILGKLAAEGALRRVARQGGRIAYQSMPLLNSS